MFPRVVLFYLTSIRNIFASTFVKHSKVVLFKREADALPALDSADATTKNLNADLDSVTQSTDTQDAELHAEIIFKSSPSWQTAIATLSAPNFSRHVLELLNDPIRLASFRSKYQGEIAPGSEIDEVNMVIPPHVSLPFSGCEDRPRTPTALLLSVSGDVPEIDHLSSLAAHTSPNQRAPPHQCPVCHGMPQHLGPTNNQKPEDLLRRFSAISAQVNALQAVYYYLREEQRELAFRIAEQS